MMRKLKMLLAFFGVVALSQACKEDKPGDLLNDLTQEQLSTIKTYLADHNIDAIEDNRGFYYRKLTENPNGTSTEVGDAVNFYYKVSTLDGQFIDEKKEGTDAPAKCALGDDRIKIPVALDAMLDMMRQGEAYEFFLPSFAAYQKFAKPGLIPENAIIQIQLKVAEILSPAEEKLLEDEQIKSYISQQGFLGVDSLDSGVYYMQTQAGGSQGIENGKTAQVRYTGTLLDSTVFDNNINSSSPFAVTIGAGSVIPGFETGIKHMHQGEKGIVLIPSHVGYEGGLTVIPSSIIGDLLDGNWIDPGYGFARKIPAYAVLRFDMEVVSIN